MVVASGVGVLVMSLGAMRALEETAMAYYERYRFAHVFATVKRAPEGLAARIAALPGVQAVETRIVESATLDIPGFAEPVIGQLVSMPEHGEPLLNRLAMRTGRPVAPGRPDEVVLGEPFAEAHGLGLGDQLAAIINGKRRTLRVVGTALSPEFVYTLGPGALVPDNQRFGVLWMGREALAAAFDLDGAFNEVSLTLLRGTSAADVIQRLDRIIDRYGGTGAYDRADQVSNWFLMADIEQLKTMSGILPTIFLTVAAFLTNMVLARLIATERSEIGLLKAFGYSDGAVAWHYAKLVMAMSIVGILLGWGVGAWLGRVNVETYAEFYRFPLLYFRLQPDAFVTAALVSLGAALFGAVGAVRRAVALPPAEAMVPPAPPSYGGDGPLDALLQRALDQPSRIVVRQILRWPVRAFLTSAGIAMSVAVLVIALHWIDAIDHMVEVFYFRAQHQDVTVSLTDARSSDVTRGFAHLPGVLAVEPVRTVEARLRAGNRSEREAVQGVLPEAHLNLIYDSGGRVLRVPPEGLVLSTKMAEMLGVGWGDTVTVEVLEGRRAVRRVPVADLFETYIGKPAYMDMAALNRLMRDRPVVSGAHLLVDESRQAELFATLKEVPAVSAVTLRRAAVDMFYRTIGETLMIYVFMFTGFACALAFGVVYNATRIALSERGRELATLRVLGFRRSEISYILLGEIGLLTLAGLPLGCLAGFGLAALTVQAFDTELYRVPLIVDDSTYGIATLICLGAAAVSAALVRRRLDRLDLVEVLKTRE